MTRVLSSSRHRRMFVSEYTTELTDPMLSFFCLRYSWSDIWRDLKGSRTCIAMIVTGNPHGNPQDSCDADQLTSYVIDQLQQSGRL